MKIFSTTSGGKGFKSGENQCQKIKMLVNFGKCFWPFESFTLISVSLVCVHVVQKVPGFDMVTHVKIIYDSIARQPCFWWDIELEYLNISSIFCIFAVQNYKIL